MTEPGAGIRGLHHVAILTTSIERSIDYYVGLLGVERPPIRAIDKPGMRLRTAMVRTGLDATTFLQLIEPEIGPGVDELAAGGDGTLYEIAFEVADIAAASRSLRSSGASVSDLLDQPIDSEYLTAQSGNRYFYLSGSATGGTRTEILEPARSANPVTGRHPRELDGRVALVTGGASGIGEAVVQGLAEQGARVAIIDLQHELAERLAAMLGGADRCIVIPGDVTDPGAMRTAAAEVIATFGTIDIAVNCAGVNRFVAPEDVDDALWRKLLAINLDGPWNACAAVIPEMIRRRSGRIVNIGSAAGVLGIPKAVPYSTAKHGIVGLTRALAVDLGPYDITVNCVAPGTTLTPLVESATSPTFKAAATERTPLGRLGQPSDLAEAVLFLVSDRAAWITGVVLPVDGGMTAVIRAHHWE